MNHSNSRFQGHTGHSVPSCVIRRADHAPIIEIVLATDVCSCQSLGKGSPWNCPPHVLPFQIVYRRLWSFGRDRSILSLLAGCVYYCVLLCLYRCLHSTPYVLPLDSNDDCLVVIMAHFFPMHPFDVQRSVEFGCGRFQ